MVGERIAASTPVDIEPPRGDEAELNFGGLFESSPEKAETIARLESYFGDQKFCYGTHSGTFADMMALCPAVDGMVEQGFDAAVSLLEPKKITEEEYQNILRPEQPNDERATAEPGSEEENEEENTVSSEQPRDQTSDTNEAAPRERVNTVATNEQYDTAMTHERDEKTDATPLPDYADSGTVEANDSGSEKVVDHTTGNEPESDTEELSKSLPIELFQSEHIVLQATEIAKTPDERSVDIPVSDEHIVVERPTVVEVAVGEPVVEVFDDTTVEAVFTPVIAPPEYVSRELAREPVRPLKTADAFQIPNKHLLDEPVEVPEHVDTREDSIPEAAPVEFDDRLPAAEDEPVEAIAQPSVLQQAYERSDDDDVQETIAEVAEDPGVDMVADAVAELVTSDPEFEADVTREECIRLLQDAEVATTRLEQATTKQECAEQLVELEASLEALLEALGYENARQLAAQLARRYDTKTLRQYIAALMRTAAAPEVTHITGTKRARSRHHWLGQCVVKRVVGTMSFSKQPLV